ncbi:MAG: hypothetical protein HYV07_10600 [Deltaproteobacteria bacterium]|nr:hypothetical protein [Deltaproteobacteria bacterium]
MTRRPSTRDLPGSPSRSLAGAPKPCRLLLRSALILGLGLGSLRAHAQSDGLSLSPAPIPDLYPRAGRWDIGLTGAGGVVFPDNRTDPNIVVVGLGGVVTRALDERWFLTGSLTLIGGSQQDSSATIAALLIGGGLHIAGDLDDWYALGAVAGLAGVSTVLSPTPFDEIQVTGAGLVIAGQAELRAFRWLSFVPYLIVTHLASVTVEENGIELINADVSLTTPTFGFDVWVYLDPDERRSHLGLGVLGTLFQPTESFIITLGYSFGFGGEEEAPQPAPPGDATTRGARQPGVLPPPVPPPPPTPSPLPPPVPPPPRPK